MTPEEMYGKQWAAMAKAEGHRPAHKYKPEPNVQVSDDLLARIMDALKSPQTRAQISEAVDTTENHVRYAIRKLEKAGKIMRLAEQKPKKGRMIPDRWKIKGEK